MYAHLGREFGDAMKSFAFLFAASLAAISLLITNGSPSYSESNSFTGQYNAPFTAPLPKYIDPASLSAAPKVKTPDADAVRFQLEVFDSSGIVVVEFMSPTCLACNPAQKILKESAKHYGSKVKLVRIDAGKNFDTFEYYGLKRVPSVLVFNDGELVEKIPVFAESKKSHLHEVIDKQLELSQVASEKVYSLEPVRLNQ